MRVERLQWLPDHLQSLAASPLLRMIEAEIFQDYTRNPDGMV
jgi:hypothetical protein